MGDHMDDAAEKRVNKKLRKRSLANKLHRDAFVRAALQTKEGREYVYWLLEICRIGANPYTGNALNTAFACGELNVGQQVQAHIIEVSPEGFLSLLAEKEKERLNDIRDKSVASDAADNDDDSSGDSSSNAPSDGNPAAG